jgi:hypothetical protein
MNADRETNRFNNKAVGFMNDGAIPKSAMSAR